MQRKLRLVGSHDPTDIFKDLDALRAQNKSAPKRRERCAETFARIPHDRALALYQHIGGAPWAVLVELDRLILKGHGQNPVALSGRKVRKLSGMSHATIRRALDKLAAAGVISIQPRRGKAPLVTHAWYPPETN